MDEKAMHHWAFASRKEGKKRGGGETKKASRRVCVFDNDEVPGPT